MNLEVREPIFVVGTGRSGSTVFFDIFAKHPHVAWLSRLADDYPHRLWLNSLLMRARSYPVVDALLGKRLGPSEAYQFWDLNCPGFSNPFRDLLAGDVTPLAAARLRESIGRTAIGRRNRFLAKITGWPRVRFLREIFPQALFIEVTRDPCATASSLLSVPFWDGWRGPSNWRRGPLPADLEAIWRQEGESFIALAAIEYTIVKRAMELCRTTLRAEQMHTVSYTNLCADPVGVFRKVIEFCGLTWSGRFEKEIRHARLISGDDKWRNSLTVGQQAVLQRTLERAETLQNR
jgi:hypothetical protein